MQLIIFIFLLAIPTLLINCQRLETLPQSRFPKLSLDDVENVKESYKYLKRLEQVDSCSKDLISNLQVECSTLNDEQKSRLSLKLSNCLLARSLKPTTPCSDQENFAFCTKSLTGDAWTTYTTFYAHIDNLCFYYQAQVWQQETQALVNSLLDVSRESALLMEDNLKFSQSMLNSQTELADKMKEHYVLSSQANEQLKESNQSLEKLRSSLSTAFDHVLQQMISQSERVGKTLGDIFEGLQEIKLAQQWMARTFTDFSTFLFYFGVSIVMFFMTSFQTFHSARSSTLLMLWSSFLLERLFLNGEQTLMFRYACVAFEAGLLAFTYKNFKDFNKLNYLQILEMQQKLSILNSAHIKRKIKACLLSLTKDLKAARSMSPMKQTMRALE